MSLLINSTETVFLIVQVLAVSFLAILFLQSGLDKVVGKKENLDWLSSHFANSPFKNFVPVLFFTIIPPHSLRTTNLRILPNVGFLIPILYSRALILINDI